MWHIYKSRDYYKIKVLIRVHMLSKYYIGFSSGKSPNKFLKIAILVLFSKNITTLKIISDTFPTELRNGFGFILKVICYI